MRIENSKRSSILSGTEALLVQKHKNELLKFMSKVGVLDRDILVMKFFQDMPEEEIAKNMGLVQQTIKDRINCNLKELDKGYY